jgi:hypothetical protein
MAFIMDKLAMINSCEIILEKYFFFAKIQVCNILIYTFYSIKYGMVLEENGRECKISTN